jgi:hypothetical protein
MTRSLRTSLALLFLGGALAGCGKNTTSPVGSTNQVEQDAIVAELAAPGNAALLEDGISDDEATVGLGSAPGVAAIHPLTYWRLFRTRDRNFEFAFGDTDSTGRPARAIVTIRSRLTGTFNILTGPAHGLSAGPDSTRIHKPLDDLRVRRVLLRRVAGPHDARVRWRVAATSGVRVSSRDHTTDITSLRIQSGALDTTITDPLEFVRMRNVLRLQPNSSVTLTVTTARNDDIVVLHRFGGRLLMTNHGDNSYSATLRIGLFAGGLRHFGVDAMSRGTLFDDVLSYDSQRWILPYVIVPEELEDPMP